MTYRRIVTTAIFATMGFGALPSLAQAAGKHADVIVIQQSHVDDRRDRRNDRAERRDDRQDRRADRRADKREDRRDRREERAERREDRREDRHDRRYHRGHDHRSPGHVYYYSARGPEFRRGHHLPVDLRSPQYVVVQPQRHHLKAPPRGHQWVQVGADYVLVAVATGLIAHIVLSH